MNFVPTTRTEAWSFEVSLLDGGRRPIIRHALDARRSIAGADQLGRAGHHGAAERHGGEQNQIAVVFPG